MKVRVKNKQTAYLILKFLSESPGTQMNKIVDSDPLIITRNARPALLKMADKKIVAVSGDAKLFTRRYFELTEYGLEFFDHMDRYLAMEYIYTPVGCRIIAFMGMNTFNTTLLKAGLKDNQRHISTGLTLLRSKGMVSSEQDENDKRVFYHHLTTKGLEVYERLKGDKATPRFQSDFNEIIVGNDKSGQSEKQLVF